MSQTLVDRIAQAVLYEGYLLYPYRPSTKNRQRWTFGGLYPRSFAEAQTGSSDGWSLDAQCLLEGEAATQVDVRLRFLHLTARQRGGWEEAVERSVDVGPVLLTELQTRELVRTFDVPAEDGCLALSGRLTVSAATVTDGLVRLRVRVENTTGAPSDAGRPEALRRALVSAHLVLHAGGGRFVSLTDPPAAWRTAVDACVNRGVWPVLVGEPGDRSTVLAAPIILGDYPEVAPESPGDLFDGTEIDEILTLRVLTLTDEEKREVRAMDSRARALLERTEALTPEQLMALHGVLRQPRAGREGGEP